MTWLWWAFLVLIWYFVIGECVLRWTGGEKYIQWKLRHSIRRGLLAVALWPLMIKRG